MYIQVYKTWPCGVLSPQNLFSARQGYRQRLIVFLWDQKCQVLVIDEPWLNPGWGREATYLPGYITSSPHQGEQSIVTAR